MDFPGNPGIGNFSREIYSLKMIRDPVRETVVATLCQCYSYGVWVLTNCCSVDKLTLQKDNRVLWCDVRIALFPTSLRRDCVLYIRDKMNPCCFKNDRPDQAALYIYIYIYIYTQHHKPHALYLEHRHFAVFYFVYLSIYFKCNVPPFICVCY